MGKQVEKYVRTLYVIFITPMLFSKIDKPTIDCTRLLNGYRFCKITWFIDRIAQLFGDLVNKKLHDTNHCKWGQKRCDAGKYKCKICHINQLRLSFKSKHNQVPFACFNFVSIRNGLAIDE